MACVLSLLLLGNGILTPRTENLPRVPFLSFPRVESSRLNPRVGMTCKVRRDGCQPSRKIKTTRVPLLVTHGSPVPQPNQNLSRAIRRVAATDVRLDDGRGTGVSNAISVDNRLPTVSWITESRTTRKVVSLGDGRHYGNVPPGRAAAVPGIQPRAARSTISTRVPRPLSLE